MNSLILQVSSNPNFIRSFLDLIFLSSTHAVSILTPSSLFIASLNRMYINPLPLNSLSTA
jgi:hypothetical protein